MRALKAATILMAVMIVAGIGILGVTILRRVTSPSDRPTFASQAVLDEPPGTRIAAISGLQDRLAVQLQGGGPDRVLFLDAQSGRVLGRAALAH